MPDACGTPTRSIKARNVHTGEELEVIIVVGDERVEFNGDYSFNLAQLRRVIGANEVPAERGLFHPTAEEAPADDELRARESQK